MIFIAQTHRANPAEAHYKRMGKPTSPTPTSSGILSFVDFFGKFYMCELELSYLNFVSLVLPTPPLGKGALAIRAVANETTYKPSMLCMLLCGSAVVCLLIGVRS